MPPNDRLLIIQDDEKLNGSLKKFLKGKGFKVDSVRTGAEALKKLKKEFYSLIVVDVKLSDMDGIKLIGFIEDTKPVIRKLITTGYPSIETAQEAIRYGVHEYIVKPFSHEQLLELIEKQLAARENEMKNLYPIIGLKKTK
jgi:two-component system response regulator HydG